MSKPNPQEMEAQRDKAILQFRKWRDKGAVCLDTETTALDGKVWQFASVDSRTLAPLLAFNCAVGGNWSEQAAKMRDAQHIQNLNDFPASNIFADVVEGNLISHPPVCWNADFDMSAIERTWPNAGDGAVAACAMRAYAPLYGQWSESKGAWKYCSLEQALERESVSAGYLPAHTAYGDAARLALLIAEVAERETLSEQAARATREDLEFYEAEL